MVIPILIAGLQKNKDSSDTKHRGEQLARRIDEVTEYVECTDDKVNRFYLISSEVLCFIIVECKVSNDKFNKYQNCSLRYGRMDDFFPEMNFYLTL